MKKQRWACCKNLHTSVTQCFEANGNTFHNPTSIGGKEAALVTRDINAAGHTSAWDYGQAEGSCRVLLVGPGGQGEPQCHTCLSQGGGRGAQGGLGDPHLLPAGSECCRVEVPLQACVGSAPAGPAPSPNAHLASKPCSWGEREKEKQKAARKVGRAEDGEKGASEPRQEEQKFSLQAVARDG